MHGLRWRGGEGGGGAGVRRGERREGCYTGSSMAERTRAMPAETQHSQEERDIYGARANGPESFESSGLHQLLSIPAERVPKASQLLTAERAFLSSVQRYSYRPLNIDVYNATPDLRLARHTRSLVPATACRRGGPCWYAQEEVSETTLDTRTR